MLHFIPILIALSLPAATPQDDPVTLKWAPAKGPIQHEWVSSHQLFLDSSVMTAGEDKQSSDRGFAITTERRLTAVDEIRAVGEGRPLEVRREYRLAEMVAEMKPLENPEAQSNSVRLTSPLADKSVVWNWIPSEGQFGRYYDGVEDKESLLPLLREDLAARSLLPAGPVAIGDTWAIDPMDLRSILEPGGQLSLASEKGSRFLMRSVRTGIGGGLHLAFEGKCAGTVQARLDQVTDGQAHMSIVLDRVRYVTELADHIVGEELARETADGRAASGGRLVIELSGTGILVWNIAAGRAIGLAVKGTEEVEVTIRSSRGDLDMVDRVKMVGAFACMYTTGPPKPPKPPESVESAEPIEKTK